jgi:hypothetical protein
MAIKQIDSSNTFAQWLQATQSLIIKNNAYEDTENVYSNTVIVYNLTANAYANVIDYSTVAYNFANNVANVANLAYNTSNNAYAHANAGYALANITYQYANNAYAHANGGYALANLAYITSNNAYAHANGGYALANLAYAFANNGYAHANASYTHANGSFNRANTAYDLANAAINIIIPPATSNANTVLSNDGVYLVWKPVVNTAVASSIVGRDSLGDIYANNFVTSSDINLKTNIKTLEDSLNTVLNLRGVSFEWIGNSRKQIGLIAQEVEPVVPYLVQESDGIKSVNYPVIVALLIEAIKELNQKIERLENK